MGAGSDFLSSGERTGKSPNQACAKVAAVACLGLWGSEGWNCDSVEIRVTIVEYGLERPATEGDSPVDEIANRSCSLYPSSAGHVEPCVNLGGPSPKAKYSLATDSEQVP